MHLPLVNGAFERTVRRQKHDRIRRAGYCWGEQGSTLRQRLTDCFQNRAIINAPLPVAMPIHARNQPERAVVASFSVDLLASAEKARAREGRLPEFDFGPTA